jgi:putative toxin-antitoxin system antitoxin component (TIGR02293 family)
MSTIAKKRAAPLSFFPNLVGVLGGKKVFISKVQSDLDLHRLIEAGLPFRALTEAAKAFGVPTRTMANVVGIPRSTFDRRKNQQRLSPEESERVYRVARIFALALLAFETPDIAADWIHKPNRALAGEKPIDMLKTEAGAREVENVLGRVIFGGYS